MCKKHDENIQEKVKHPLTADQIKQNEENKKQQQEEQAKKAQEKNNSNKEENNDIKENT